MPKLRKQRRRQSYRHNVNRKRLRNKINNVGKISCPEVKEAWDRNKSLKLNMEEMGLAYDPNEVIKITSTKSELKQSMKKLKDEEIQEPEKETPCKSYVVEKLKEEAGAPRERKFRLPNGQVEFLSYFIEKYGSDFKAMARDKKNYYQETWRKLRSKIKTFRGIPEQYNKFLEDRNLDKDPISDSAFLDDGDDE